MTKAAFDPGVDDLTTAPEDAAARRDVEPVICYPTDSLPAADLALYRQARQGAVKTDL